MVKLEFLHEKYAPLCPSNQAPASHRAATAIILLIKENEREAVSVERHLLRGVRGKKKKKKAQKPWRDEEEQLCLSNHQANISIKPSSKCNGHFALAALLVSLAVTSLHRTIIAHISGNLPCPHESIKKKILKN